MRPPRGQKKSSNGDHSGDIIGQRVKSHVLIGPFAIKIADRVEVTVDLKAKRISGRPTCLKGMLPFTP
jgi:hypothetical protein